jgi:hypothetical protein
MRDPQAPSIADKIIEKYSGLTVAAVANLTPGRFAAAQDLPPDFVTDIVGAVLLIGPLTRSYTFGEDNEATLHFQFKGGDTSLLKEYMEDQLTEEWAAKGDTISIKLEGHSGKDIPGIVKLFTETLQKAVDAYQAGVRDGTAELLRMANKEYRRRIAVTDAFKALEIYPRETSKWDGLKL